jgi:endonuclease-3
MPKTIDLQRLLKLLIAAYGRPRPFRRTDAVDEIVRTILSQNTNDRNSLAAFAVLKKAAGPWQKLMNMPAGKIARLIRHAGLSNIKAVRIKGVVRDIASREGKISLRRLGSMCVEEGFEYLTSLKGIGPKTASCVLLFSFAKPVMPVDTHIFRVAKRLGLIPEKANIEEAHRILTGICGKNTRLIYDLHLSIIEHGRRTCRAQNPRCGSCVLYGCCRFKDKKNYIS